MVQLGEFVIFIILLLDVVVLCLMLRMIIKIKKEDERFLDQLEKPDIPELDRLNLSKELHDCWKSFYQDYKENLKNGYSIPPDIYDHFLEEKLVQSRGWRRVADIIPGTFLAIGILGTFLGLVSATFGIHANGDSHQLQQGVSHLISGMSSAFWASIVGISSSIFWQFIDKTIYHRFLLNRYHTLCDKLDERFPAPDLGALLKEMSNNQKSHMEDFKIYMSENLIPQVAMKMAEALENIFVPHLNRSEAMMENVLKQTSENQMSGMKEMVDSFVHSLNQVAGDHMKNLESALRQTVEWQEKVHGEMVQLVDSLEKSAEKQAEMVSKTTKLTEEIQQYTDRLSEYQDVLGHAVAELNQTADKNKQLHTAFSDLLEKMLEERKEFEEQLQRLQQNVSIINENTSLQNTLHQTYRDLTEQWNVSLSQIRSLTDGNRDLLEKVQAHGETFSEIQSGLASVLTELNQSHKTSEEIFSRIVDIQQMVLTESERIDGEKNHLQQMLTTQLEQMDQRLKTLRDQWNETHQLMQEVNEQLSGSAKHFAEQLHKGLERTFNQFDEELSKAVQTLASGVHSLEDLLTELPNHIEAFNHHVGDFHEKLGQSIKETHGSINKAIQELNQTTERLLQQSHT
jgi:uncharacterized coiled-coil DUF342 family protein